MALEDKYEMNSLGLDERSVRSEEVLWLRRHPQFAKLILVIQENR